MKIVGQGKLLRIFIGESDTYHHTTLYEAIVTVAREKGLAGATVIRGIEGFGANSRLFKAKLLDLSSELPIVVEIVDYEEKINLLLPVIKEMIEKTNCGAMITLEKTEIIHYTHKK